MKLVFVHGWGSDISVWDSMIDAFQEHECHRINLGFIGDEDISVPEGKFIGIGHSLGGMWLLKRYPEQMIGFISIASFNCFYRYIPKSVLSMMQNNIVKDAAAQLQDFWRSAGLDQPKGFKNLKSVKLLEGLAHLAKWKVSIPLDTPIKVLASRDDKIVPEKMTQSIWAQYDIEWINDGGHMLPLTQPEWCIQHIKKFIHDTK